MEKISLKKQAYAKEQFINTIDTNFTQLANTLPTNAAPTQVSVDQFFQEYQDLFYIIPKFGSTNSHEYLIKTSTDYIGTTAGTNDGTIQALIDEINTLRQQNLTLQQTQVNQTISSVQATLENLNIKFRLCSMVLQNILGR
jgi:hypothetical protein